MTVFVELLLRRNQKSSIHFNCEYSVLRCQFSKPWSDLLNSYPKVMEERKFILLIVDDNISFIDRVISLLEDSCRFKRIEIAHDYNEAIESLENKNPDIVLLDINLPGKSGMEILREIKKRRRKHLVIMISNHDNEYYREQCKKLGADHFLDKTGDFEMLPSIINSY